MNAAGPGCLRPRNFATGFAILLLLWFSRVLLGGESFVLRDFGVFGYPLAHYHRETFWQGSLPLWNPLTLCGIPWLAQWNTLTLYPGTLLYLLPPLPWSLNFFCLAHLWLAGCGMYCLARKWTRDDAGAAFAGVLFGLGGLTQNCLMWPNNIAALAWLPLVLLAVSTALSHGGRAMLPAMLAGAMQMLTGAPEIILFTWLSALGIAILHPTACGTGVWARFAILVLGVTALSAIQLLPFLELLRNSSRVRHGGEADWSIGAFGWIHLFMPLFETRTKGTGAIYHASQAWTHSYYLGLPALGLAVLGWFAQPRRRRAGVLLALALSIGLAIGFQSNPLEHLPPFSLIRYPVKYVLLWSILVPLLAAFGVKALEGSRDHPRPSQAVGITVVLAVLGALIVVLRPAPDSVFGRDIILSNYLVRTLAALLIGALLWAARRPGHDTRIRFQLAALAVLTLDLLIHQPGLHPSIPSRWFTAPNPILPSFDDTVRAGRARVHAVFSRQMQTDFSHNASLLESFQLTRIGLAQNWNLVEGIAKADGFVSLWTPSQGNIATSLYHDADEIPVGLADFLGIRNLSAEENTFEWPGRSGALPWIGIGAEPRFAGNREIFQSIQQPDFDPRRIVWLPEEAASRLEAVRPAEATVTNLVLETERIRFTALSPAPTLATVAVSHYPAWRAYVDDKPTQLLVANHGFMGLVVPAGEHAVEIRYEDRAFRIGRMITLTALLAFAVAWRRSRPQAPPPKLT